MALSEPLEAFQEITIEEDVLPTNEAGEPIAERPSESNSDSEVGTNGEGTTSTVKVEGEITEVYSTTSQNQLTKPSM